jgi:hypothetical protein
MHFLALEMFEYQLASRDISESLDPIYYAPTVTIACYNYLVSSNTDFLPSYPSYNPADF